MQFLTSLSLAISLATLTNAVPTLTERSTNFCPGQSHLTPAIQCSSGFSGCVDYARGSAVCNGPKRFFNDCSGAPGLGSFFKCANGFAGCSTNPGVCDTAPSARSVAPGTCAEGQGTWYVCATGFKGCSTNPRICDPAPVPQTPAGTPPSSDCPAGSAFYVCANGFRGCSTNTAVCDKPASVPITPTTPVVLAPKSAPICAAGTWYARPSECASGFVGCTSESKVCGGEKRFWGSCPPNHGNYFNCANGFVGCTTDNSICDKKVL